MYSLYTTDLPPASTRRLSVALREETDSSRLRRHGKLRIGNNDAKVLFIFLIKSLVTNKGVTDNPGFISKSMLASAPCSRMILQSFSLSRHQHMRGFSSRNESGEFFRKKRINFFLVIFMFNCQKFWSDIQQTIYSQRMTKFLVSFKLLWIYR